MGAMLAIAIVISDIGQLVKTVTPNVKGKKNDLVNTLVPVSWIMVSCVNAGFTWWNVQMVIDAGQSKMPVVLANNSTYTSALAVFIAIFVFIIRLLLATSFGSVLEGELGVTKVESESSKFRQQQIQNQRTPTPTFHTLNPQSAVSQNRSAMSVNNQQ